MKLAGKRVKMMRCQFSPVIMGKTMLAHDFDHIGWIAHVNDEGSGVCIQVPESENVKEKRVFFVPFTNTPLIEYYDSDPAEESKAKKPTK